MSAFLYLAAGLAVGAVVAYLWSRVHWGVRLSRAEAERDFEKRRCDALQDDLERRRKTSEAELERLREDNRLQLAESLKAMKATFSTLSQEVMDAQSRKFAENGEARLAGVVRPLQDHLEQLGRALQDAGKEGASRKTSFDEAMRRLTEQTSAIGIQAESLTRALKGESKTQGDWGEMILDTILQNSNLEKGVEYDVQKNVKDENGQNLRPDVIVHFPDGRSVVIDSKVSLTAFFEYVNASDDVTRDVAARNHVASVRRQVDLLQKKQYENLVSGSDKYVLMFMQSDAAYVLAVKTDPRLSEEAFKKRVIIVSPTTLMMTLQIIYNIWQSDRQNRNVEKIVAKANSLYDKFVGFIASFQEIDRKLGQVQTAYETANRQLCEGKGNLVKMTDDLRKMGLNPKKQLPESLQDTIES